MSFSRTYLLSTAVASACFTGFPRHADADDYFVRTDGNNNCSGLDDSAGESGNCAFRDIQVAVDAAGAGDTVTVHAGDYSTPIPTFTSARSGSAGNLITIRAAEGETVTLSRAVIEDDYIVVRGFLVVASGNYSASGIQLNGSYTHALHNTILGNCRADSGACSGFGIAGDYNVISHNVLDGGDNGEDTSFTWGMHISGSHNELTHNTVLATNSIERVFELYGSFNRIADNEVGNVRWTIGDGSHPDIFQVFGTSGSHDQLIENNYFHDFEGQVGNLGLDGNEEGWYNWVFRNNVFANITMEFFIYFPVQFFNNTFYRVTTTNTGWPLYPCYAVGRVTSLNNAFIACGTGDGNGWYNACGGSTGDYDFVSATAEGGAKSDFSEEHGVNGGDPRLAAVHDDCAATPCDFHAGDGSALIDRGCVVDGYAVDKDGTARTGAWDIGAYEYLVPQPCADTGGTCCERGSACEGGRYALSTDCGLLCCMEGTCAAEAEEPPGEEPAEHVEPDGPVETDMDGGADAAPDNGGPDDAGSGENGDGGGKGCGCAVVT